MDDIEFSITSDILNSDDICFYSSEKDLEVELDFYGAKGSDRGSFIGGEGGYSRIQFTMKKNEEYTQTRTTTSLHSSILYLNINIISLMKVYIWGLSLKLSSSNLMEPSKASMYLMHSCFRHLSSDLYLPSDASRQVGLT